MQKMWYINENIETEMFRYRKSGWCYMCGMYCEYNTTGKGNDE